MRGRGGDRGLAREEVPHGARAKGLEAHREGAVFAADEGRAVALELVLQLGALPAEIGEAIRGELEPVGDLRGGRHCGSPSTVKTPGPAAAFAPVETHRYRVRPASVQGWSA